MEHKACRTEKSLQNANTERWPTEGGKKISAHAKLQIQLHHLWTEIRKNSMLWLRQLLDRI